MKNTGNQQDKDERLSVFDRILWYAIGIATGGIFPGVLFAIWLESDWGLLIGFLVWAPCVWLLEMVGFWLRLERIVLAIWHPFGKFLGAIFAAFEIVFTLISSVIFGVLAGLLGLTLVAFVVFGVAGLLWFGIRQLF